jgi:hypothetical protein
MVDEFKMLFFKSFPPIGVLPVGFLEHKKRGMRCLLAVFYWNFMLPSGAATVS